jgi:rhodanese-related sulfurtransferase
MSRITLSLLAVAALSLTACGGESTAVEASAPAAATEAAPAAKAEVAIAETPMDTVESKLASGDCTVFDANSPDTRTANGVIEGAVLLDSYREYDLASLPSAKDAQLVFYCGSTMCTASDKAAHRAIEAGYSNVSVMREGIKGWKKAGKKTVEWSAPVQDAQDG